jgi:transposase
MDETLDLETASRAALLALIAAQQQTIATLEGRVGELERRLGSSGGKGMPGTKPAAATRTTAPRQARKRRDRGYGRVRSLTPTQRVVHATEQCPACTTPLIGGWVERRREVIELPAAPVQVTEHIVLSRRCPTCHGTVTPPLDLTGVVVGKQRLGVGLQSLIVTLREVGRWPVAQIQWYLQTLHGLHLSTGAIVAACHRVAAAGQTALQQIRDAIRASPVVHLDETGWRENGVNGYVWTASTPTERYFVRGSRAGAMVEAILGEATTGVLCCDGYAGYHHYAGRKQRCWAHVLRDIHDLTGAYPDDRALGRWARRMQRLYAAAVAFEHPDARVRLRAQRRFEQRLERLCRPFTTDPLAVQAKRCRTLLRHLPERFVFVAEPAVPPDNNAAERSLRPLVTTRKISGGTRSPHGTATRMTLTSLFGTARVRGLDPLLTCASVLTTGQL